MKNFSFNATVWGLIKHLFLQTIGASLLTGLSIFIVFIFMLFVVNTRIDHFWFTLIYVYLGVIFSYLLALFFCRWFVSNITFGKSATELVYRYDTAKDFLKGYGRFILLVIGLGCAFPIMHFISPLSYLFFDNAKIDVVIMVASLLIYILLLLASLCLIWGYILSEVVKNTYLGDKPFSIKKGFVGLSLILFVESLLWLVLFVPTLGIYSIWAFKRIVRRLSENVEHSSRSLKLSKDFTTKNIFYMFLASFILTTASFGILGLWRFIKDTDQVLGYLYLE